MSMKQLNTLLKFERDKEANAAQQLQKSELEYQQNITRLNDVADYRLEYMKRLMERSKVGIDNATLSHFHNFIAKLDNAAEQVEIAVKQAKALVDHSKNYWLGQRQKVKAVEHLRETQLKKAALIEQKNEQKMFDEIATQQFVRRTL